jgi:hypothetical protein
MSNRNRTLVLFAALAAIYLLSALIDPCDGHSCPQGGNDVASTLSAD